MLCCCKDPESPPVSPIAKHAPARELANQNSAASKSAKQQRNSKAPNQKSAAKAHHSRVVNPNSIILTEKTVISPKMAANLEAIVSRLEAVTSRLEGVSGAAAGAPASSQSSGALV